MKQRRYVQLNWWHKIFMVLGGVASIWSWKWSFNLFNALFSDIVTAGIIATMITFLELYSIYQIVMTGHWGWLFLASFGFVSSVAGSFGNFQTNFEKNVLASDSYTRLEQEINRLEGQINDAKTAKKQYTEMNWPGNAQREQNNIDRYQKQKDVKTTQLNDMKTQGAGTSNAIFRSVARLFSTSAMNAAERMNFALGIFVECFMLLATAISATVIKNGEVLVSPNEKKYKVSWDEEGNQQLIPIKAKPKEIERPEPEPRPLPTPRPTPEESPIPVIAKGQGDNGVKHTPPSSRPRPERETNQFKIDPGFRSGSAKSKIDLTAAKKRAKEKRIRKLREFIAENPGAKMEDKMKAIGVNSPNTVRNYEREIEHRI